MKYVRAMGYSPDQTSLQYRMVHSPSNCKPWQLIVYIVSNSGNRPWLKRAIKPKYTLFPPCITSWRQLAFNHSQYEVIKTWSSRHNLGQLCKSSGLETTSSSFTLSLLSQQALNQGVPQYKSYSLSSLPREFTL